MYIIITIAIIIFLTCFILTLMDVASMSDDALLGEGVEDELQAEWIRNYNKKKGNK